MTCACGHHHPRPVSSGEGMSIPLAKPMIALTGRLICSDAAQMMTALTLLPEHVELSRAEAGCLRFDIWQDEDPLIWHLSEVFLDADAFAAHQLRAAASNWGRQSGEIERDFQKREAEPLLRPEQSGDAEAIDTLLRSAFGGDDEVRLVKALRERDELGLSLVAEIAGTVIGHAGLSPITGDHPALALAPVAVSPKAQGVGIGSGLIHHALAWAGQTPVVVLGEPEYYRRFGFVPAELDSPYAGPYLQLHGGLPVGSAISHSSAFSVLQG